MTTTQVKAKFSTTYWYIL